MILDYISDLHFDAYLSEKNLNNNSEKKLLILYDKVFFKHKFEKKRKYLFISGDLANSNDYSIFGLNLLNKYYYEKIIFILGNHDYYISKINLEDGVYQNSFDRIEEFKYLIESNKNLIYLDGKTIKIEGFTIGGFNSWYDGMFSKYYNYLNTDKEIQYFWENYMLDSSRIHGIEKYNDIFYKEIKKIEKIYKTCDIILSHVSPTYLKEGFSLKYRNDKSNCFFSFNGHKYLKSKKLKYWIFGHTHEIVKFQMFGTKILSNPFGYPSESKDKKVKTIIISKEKNCE
jgi:metallophosphoesterase superfamily enzyme